MRRSERVWRGVLALAIAGLVPLSIWGSSCSSTPVVQPDAAGQGGSTGSGGVAGGDSGGAGGSQPTMQDASDDAASLCCSESEPAQCTADGRQLRRCATSFNAADHAQCAGNGSPYAHVWQVQDCSTACVIVDGGLAGPAGATCQ